MVGVECPYPEATGQFIYPVDCNFFVNCWKGRAFIQPCAPGTRFNPETLECDFPHKVKCYGGELADFVGSDYSQPEIPGAREPLSDKYSTLITAEFNVCEIIEFKFDQTHSEVCKSIDNSFCKFVEIKTYYLSVSLQFNQLLYFLFLLEI